MMAYLCWWVDPSGKSVRRVYATHAQYLMNLHFYDDRVNFLRPLAVGTKCLLSTN
jgi:hypothetical protein